ncbi:MAG: DUF4998 domain-containing protein [Bacteroidales bacterium]|jgi:hypothetical protein
MKSMIKYIFILFTLSLSFGCAGMDEYYKEHIANGPILYIGKVDSAVAFAGRDRLMIRWMRMQDPRAEKAVISWANRTDSLVVNLGGTDRYTSVIINNLESGVYSFRIVTYDKNRNSSVPVEILGNVYGDDFEKYLKPRPHTFYSKTTKLIQFKKVTGIPSFVETEISYTKTGMTTPTIVKLSGQETDIILTDCDVTKVISYRGVHLPEPGCIDKFYSKILTIEPI